MVLDLRKLDHLLTVAHEGSFTRAASRLHLSQQALSTSIQALEREVGVKLLRREQNGVTALPAGEALIADARVLTGLATTALRRARGIGREETEPLRIGHTPAVTGDEVTAWLRHHLDSAVHSVVQQRYPYQLSQELLAGELDVGLCRGMPAPYGLTRTTLTSHRLSIAVSRQHHLADREELTLAQLAEERFVVWGLPGKSGYTDILLNHCRDNGFEPAFVGNPMQGTPPVTAVIGTDDVAFVTAPPGLACDGRVCVITLRPEIRAPMHALSSPHRTSQPVQSLLDSAET